MSVRPHEAAESASRFSLRSVFTGAFEDAVPLEAAKPHPNAAPPMSAPSAPSAARAPFLAVAAGPNSNLKFTLPQMRSNVAVGASAGNEKAVRHLQAGFLSGGTPQTTQETLRLNGMIADLHSKLDASTARCVEGQAAVDRANKRLQNDRVAYSARVSALSAELRAAQMRETAARAELAAAPRQSALDVERFKLQAEGAVELQAKFDEAVARAEELETLVAETNAAYLELQAKHAGLEAALVEAKVAAETAAETAPAVPTADCGDDHSVEAATVEGATVEGAAADEAAKPEEEAEAAEEASLEPAVDAAILAIPAAEPETGFVQKIEAHEETIKGLEQSVAEADRIIKSNDQRIWELSAERDAALQASAQACCERDSIAKELEASVTLRAEDEEALGRVTAAALEASDAAAVVAKAGANASPAMHAEAGRKLMVSNRLRTSFETGLPAAATVALSIENRSVEPFEASAIDEARHALAVGMNLGAGCFGIAAPALDQSCGIDLHRVSAAECCTDVSTAALTQHEQEALTQQQVRVNELVQCISTDLKWTLGHYATTFKTKAAVA